MSNNGEMKFAKAIFFNHPSENSSPIVIGRLAIKKSEFISFIESQDGEWINLKILNSKNPDKKPYLIIDEFKPDSSKGSYQNRSENASESVSEAQYIKIEDNDDLPF